MFSFLLTEKKLLQDLKEFYQQVNAALPENDGRTVMLNDCLKNVTKLQVLSTDTNRKEKYLSELKYHWEEYLLNFDTTMDKNPKAAFDKKKYEQLSKQFQSVHEVVLKRTLNKQTLGGKAAVEKYGENNVEQRLEYLINLNLLTPKREAQENAAKAKLQRASLFSVIPEREEAKIDVKGDLIRNIKMIEEKLKEIKEGLRLASGKTLDLLATKQAALSMLSDFLRNLKQQQKIDWPVQKQEFAHLMKTISEFPNIKKKEMNDITDIYKTVESKLDEVAAVKISKSSRDSHY